MPVRPESQAAFRKSRFHVTLFLVGLALSVLIARLYDLQVLKGAHYKARSASNFVQERRIAHSRGLVLDQAGRVLVDNRSSHDVYITVALIPDSNRSLRRLAGPLGLSRAQVDAFDTRILHAVDEAQPAPVVLAPHASRAQCEGAEAVLARHALRGVDVEWRTDGTDGCIVRAKPRVFPSRAGIVRRVFELAGVPEEERAAKKLRTMKKARGLRRFKPVLLVDDVGHEAYARIEAAASLGELPGVSVIDAQRRRYIHGAFATHVLGYLGEVTPGELGSKDGVSYHMGDQLGRKGLERTYERTLRGADGTEQVVVDAKGRRLDDATATELVGDERVTPPEPGRTLVLSIDEHLQREAEDAFLGQEGSVVALDVKTGHVLAMASFPDFDPNALSGPERAKVWKKLRTDPEGPLLNKAIQDHYAPGSTFKAITAIAGLREGLIRPSSTRMCPGFFKLGRTTWRCYNRAGHGPIGLLKALQHSCDTYFYSLGYEMGADKLAATAHMLGLGERTGIDVDGEIRGIMPDRAYYKKRRGYYVPGFVVNSSIGQGDVAATPLQLAVAYAAIANGGTVFQPQLVREVRAADGAVLEQRGAIVRAELASSPEMAQHLEDVRRSLGHVTDRGGTAYGLLWNRDMPDVSAWLRTGEVRIAGKTGTAQVVKLSKNVAHLKPEEVEYAQRDHAWFVGFAPADNPEIVVVTMTEHGGFGGTASAPVVARVIKAWYDHVRGQGRYADLATTAATPKPARGARVRHAPRAAPPSAHDAYEQDEHDEHDHTDPDVQRALDTGAITAAQAEPAPQESSGEAP